MDDEEIMLEIISNDLYDLRKKLPKEISEEEFINALHIIMCNRLLNILARIKGSAEATLYYYKILAKHQATAHGILDKYIEWRHS